MTDAEKKIVEEIFEQVQEHSSRKAKKDRGVLVAMGDSWFDLEKSIILGDLDFGHHVLDQLEDLGYDVKSVARAGDTIHEMALPNSQFKKLSRELQKLKDDDKKPLAILISGGGNDLVDDLKVMLNDRSASPPTLNENEVKDVVDVRLREKYVRLLNLVGGMCKKIFNSDSSIPVLVHGYAHAVPDGRSILFLMDSWLEPKFKKKGYTDLFQNTETVKCLIDRFNRMLADICQQKEFPHVRYVNVRDCLTNDLGLYKKDWDDELHPEDDAFKRVALKFDKAINKITKESVQTEESTDNAACE